MSANGHGYASEEFDDESASVGTQSTQYTETSAGGLSAHNGHHHGGRMENGDGTGNGSGRSGNGGEITMDDEEIDVMGKDEDGKSSDALEMSADDAKIVQLYEVVNELIEEHKSRTNDMVLLQRGEAGEQVIQVIEARSDQFLQSLYKELDLKKSEEEENDLDEDEEEDETDENWEIYNGVVKNFNEYMEAVADLFSTMIEHRRAWEERSQAMATESDLIELEKVLMQQTDALRKQVERNDELENALRSVLAEYSSRINTSNHEISSLHSQLSQQNEIHSKQLLQLKDMYEQQFDDLRAQYDDEAKKEVDQLLMSLSNSRDDFQSQISSLTRQMQKIQSDHRKEIQRKNTEINSLNMQLMDATSALEQSQRLNATSKTSPDKSVISWEEKQAEELEILVDGLAHVRTELDIDEEYDYSRRSGSSSRSHVQTRSQFGSRGSGGSSRQGPHSGSFAKLRDRPRGNSYEKPLPAAPSGPSSHSSGSKQSYSRENAARAAAVQVSDKYFRAPGGSSSSSSQQSHKSGTSFGTGAFGSKSSGSATFGSSTFSRTNGSSGHSGSSGLSRQQQLGQIGYIGKVPSSSSSSSSRSPHRSSSRHGGSSGDKDRHRRGRSKERIAKRAQAHQQRMAAAQKQSSQGNHPSSSSSSSASSSLSNQRKSSRHRDGHRSPHRVASPERGRMDKARGTIHIDRETGRAPQRSPRSRGQMPSEQSSSSRSKRKWFK